MYRWFLIFTSLVLGALFLHPARAQADRVYVYLTVCSRTSQQISVAVEYFSDAGIDTQGWYNVAAGDCSRAGPAMGMDDPAGEFGVYAYGAGGTWGGKTPGYSPRPFWESIMGCVAKPQAFHYAGNDQSFPHADGTCTEGSAVPFGMIAKGTFPGTSYALDINALGASQKQSTALNSCKDKTLALVSRIAVCTQVINSDGAAPLDRAAAYSQRAYAYEYQGRDELAIADDTKAIRLGLNNEEIYTARGTAYSSRGQSDLAIADYSHALRINPNYVDAYNNRGIEYTLKGRYDLAIADYNRQLSINPNDQVGHVNRAKTYFYLGLFTVSIADFADAPRASSWDPSVVLWAYVARVRAGQDARGLAAKLPSLGTKWPAPIVNFYQGKVTAAQTLSSTATKYQRCAAIFFIAEWNLWHRHEQAARGGFQQTLATCPSNFDEHTGAKAELARLRR